MTNNPNPTGDKPVVTQDGPFHVSRSTDGKNYWFSARDAASGVSIPAKSKTDAQLLVRSINMACTLFATRHREQDTLSRDGREAFTADELYEMVRPIWHYAPRGTGDGGMFFASERGQMLMRSMEKIAAALKAQEG